MVRAVVLGFSALVVCTALDDVALVFMANTHCMSAIQRPACSMPCRSGPARRFIALTRFAQAPPILLYVIGTVVSSAGNLLPACHG